MFNGQMNRKIKKKIPSSIYEMDKTNEVSANGLLMSAFPIPVPNAFQMIASARVTLPDARKARRRELHVSCTPVLLLAGVPGGKGHQSVPACSAERNAFVSFLNCSFLSGVP